MYFKIEIILLFQLLHHFLTQPSQLRHLLHGKALLKGFHCNFSISICSTLHLTYRLHLQFQQLHFIFVQHPTQTAVI